MMGLRWFFKEGGYRGIRGIRGFKVIRVIRVIKDFRDLRGLTVFWSLNEKGCAFGAAFVGVIWRMIILPSGVRAS